MISTPSGDTCIAYLIRHGATDNNLADPPLLQGRSADGSLSAEGLQQAQLAAAKLAGCGITGVFSSPLRRACETAEKIAAHYDLPVQIIPEITEVDVGAWEGRSWVEIEQNETEGYRRFVEHPDEHGYRDGENLGQVRDRVVPALDRLMSEHLGQRIAIVAHNVVNRVYLATNVRLPLARARGIPQNNCGINVLRYRGKQGEGCVDQLDLSPRRRLRLRELIFGRESLPGIRQSSLGFRCRRGGIQTTSDRSAHRFALRTTPLSRATAMRLWTYPPALLAGYVESRCDTGTSHRDRRARRRGPATDRGVFPC